MKSYASHVKNKNKNLMLKNNWDILFLKPYHVNHLAKVFFPITTR